MRKFKRVLSIFMVMLVFAAFPIAANGAVYMWKYVEDTTVAPQDYKGGDISSDYSKAAYYDLVNDYGIENFFIPVEGIVPAGEGDSLLGIPIFSYDRSSGVLTQDAQDAQENAYKLSGDVPEAGVHATEVKVLPSSTYSLEGYTDDVLGKVPTAGATYGVLRKTGTNTDFMTEFSNPSIIAPFSFSSNDPVLYVLGDNSWFNGDFYLDEGAVVIDESASIFGGNIYTRPYTLLSWEGGAKSEYNNPRVSMGGNSRFELISKSVPTFSLYSEITGLSTDKVVISAGALYINSDCSEFEGNVYVKDNSNIYLRSATSTPGAMFGGSLNMYDDQEDLSDDCQVNIYSNYGLTPLSVNNGMLNIFKDTSGSVQENSLIDSLVVASGAAVNVSVGGMTLKDTELEGTLFVNADDTELLNLSMSQGAKLYLMKETDFSGNADITDSAILGDYAYERAGTYDSSGVRTAFTLSVSSPAIDSGKISADITGLQDRTEPKGKISFAYSTGNYSVITSLGETIVSRASVNAIAGKAEVSLSDNIPAGATLYAWYTPATADNYITDSVKPTPKQTSGSGSKSTSPSAEKPTVTPNSDDSTYKASIPEGTPKNAPITFKPSKGETLGEGTVLRVTAPADKAGEFIGKSVVNADGSITFIVPDDVEFEVVDNAKRFDDVDDEWFAGNVDFTSARELFNGTTDKTFSPHDPTTRAMFAAILWRLEMKPMERGNQFDDISAEAYYANAVLWAEENGIIKGIGNNKFAPNRDISRQELVTMMFRYAEYLGLKLDMSSDLSSFADADKVGKYAEGPMKWAVKAGIIEGKENELDPSGKAKRCETAAILQRFVEYLLGSTAL